jgi:hypothetical protein
MGRRMIRGIIQRGRMDDKLKDVLLVIVGLTMVIFIFYKIADQEPRVYEGPSSLYNKADYK